MAENKDTGKKRKATVRRTTKETEIFSFLSIDGEKKIDIKTPAGFFDHLLELFGHHGNLHLMLRGEGDIEVDYHHLVEDVGLVLGEAFKKALGDKKGINRYGDIVLPMDEALVMVALDFSGRSYLNFDVNFPTEKVGDFDLELIQEFFRAFSQESGLTLHIKMLEGNNAHHIAEAIFKGFGRAVNKAIKLDGGGEIPSTKGKL